MSAPQAVLCKSASAPQCLDITRTKSSQITPQKQCPSFTYLIRNYGKSATKNGNAKHRLSKENLKRIAANVVQRLSAAAGRGGRGRAVPCSPTVKAEDSKLVRPPSRCTSQTTAAVEVSRNNGRSWVTGTCQCALNSSSVSSTPSFSGLWASAAFLPPQGLTAVPLQPPPSRLHSQTPDSRASRSFPRNLPICREDHSQPGRGTDELTHGYRKASAGKGQSTPARLVQSTPCFFNCYLYQKEMILKNPDQCPLPPPEG